MSTPPANAEYDIELLLQRIRLDPGNLLLHESLRSISLRREAAGGLDLAMLEKMQLSARQSDSLLGLIYTEKLLSYDPCNADRIAAACEYAAAAGLHDVAKWFESLLRQLDH